MPKTAQKSSPAELGLRRGRPPSEAAESHAAILDAVYELLQEGSARDLTMEAVAKRAKVGRPTLYKWWPSKSALVLAMFHERIARDGEVAVTGTAEEVIRGKVRRLIRELNGLFGKVLADLIAEGQSEPAILQDLYEQHMKSRRAATTADVERGKAAGEFAADVDPEFLIDAIFSPLFLRLLLRQAPLTERYGDALIDQVLLGARPRD
jgi:AcrR family transcriptional regulator